jgi:hypothetical protein
MQLTLEQTATRLGKSKRQVLYMIQKGRLQAQKIAGRWWIESHHLPRSDAQQHSYDRKQRQLRAAVEEALEIDPEAARSRRYSVRDLKAFQIALPLYHQALETFGAEHPATRCLKGVLEQLTRGCHRFDRSDKSEAYRAARDQASLAVCELVLAGSEVADQLIHALEQDLMAALAGLMRRVDRRRRP